MFIVGVVHPQVALCFPGIAYHSAAFTFCALLVIDHHTAGAVNTQQQGPSPVPIPYAPVPNPYENTVGKTTSSNPKKGKGAQKIAHAAKLKRGASAGPAGQGAGRPAGKKNKPGSRKPGPTARTEKRKAEEARAPRITNFFPPPASAPADVGAESSPRTATPPTTVPDTNHRRQGDGAEQQQSSSTGQGSGAEQQSGSAGQDTGGSGGGSGGGNGKRRKHSSGPEQGTGGERQQQRKTRGGGSSSGDGGNPPTEGSDSDSEQDEDGYLFRLSRAQLQWVAEVRAKVTAGIVHEHGNVVEKDGGFPYDGGWALPPLTSRQKVSGDAIVFGRF